MLHKSGDLLLQFRAVKDLMPMKVDLSWAEYNPGVAYINVEGSLPGEADVGVKFKTYRIF